MGFPMAKIPAAAGAELAVCDPRPELTREAEDASAVIHMNAKGIGSKHSRRLSLGTLNANRSDP